MLNKNCMRGLCVRQVVGASPPAEDVGVVHAPIAVLPVPFPEASFCKVQRPPVAIT